MGTARGQRMTGPNNPNWKGGRSISSHGYVLVNVGKDHPLADVRGYAYEHRLVAQERVGRPLRLGEEVHHTDEREGNNAPSNLELCGSRHEHKVRHRRSGKALRLPGEDNPTIECACGCGTAFDRYDTTGRPRRFVSGHNPFASPAKAAVLQALCAASSPLSVTSIAAATGKSGASTRTILWRLKRIGAVERLSRGVWTASALQGPPRWPADPRVREFPTVPA